MTPDVGELAPDFTLPDSDGAQRRLVSLLGGGRLVLVFFRGHW